MTSKSLFTFLMDWDGGTYISQSYGTDVAKATVNWVKQLDSNVIITSQKNLECFTKSILEELSLIPIKDNISVWCISEFLDDKLAIVHVVETSECESSD